MGKDTNFATRFGRFVGAVFIGCLGTCLMAVLISLTVKFIELIF